VRLFEGVLRSKSIDSGPDPSEDEKGRGTIREDEKEETTSENESRGHGHENEFARLCKKPVYDEWEASPY